jgi:hypothetical protein
MLVAAASFSQALQLEPKQWLDLNKRFDPKQTQDTSLSDLSIHKKFYEFSNCINGHCSLTEIFPN